VYDLIGRDPTLLRELWWEVDTRGQFHLGGTPVWPAVQASGFLSGSSTHSDRLRTIAMAYERYRLIVDPHTADGLKVALQNRDPAVPMICLETALPVKFADTIVEAIGVAPPRPPAFDGIEARPQRFETIEADAAALKDYIARHAC
jgi:threonine synthase